MERALASEAERAWRSGGRAVQVAALVGAGLMLVGVLHGLGFLVLGGPWTGPVAWRKPLAFGLSFGLTTITVAWLVSRLRLSGGARWLVLAPLAAATTVEVAWVSVQRARAVPSHFNTATPADALAFALGGGAAIAVTVAVLVAVTVLAWRRPDAPPALASGIRAGLGILLAAQAVGAVMIQRGFASAATGTEASHAVSPAGDLKVVHALAMHAVQVLPVLALWLLAAGVSAAAALAAVRIASVGYALVVLASLVQATLGRALLDPAPVTMALVALGLGAVAVALAPALRAR